MKPVNIVFGVRHLLGGRFWTPRHLSLDSDDEADVRDVLDHWAEQQAVVWLLSRGLAWATLLRLVWRVVCGPR